MPTKPNKRKTDAELYAKAAYGEEVGADGLFRSELSGIAAVVSAHRKRHKRKVQPLIDVLTIIALQSNYGRRSIAKQAFDALAVYNAK